MKFNRQEIYLLEHLEQNNSMLRREALDMLQNDLYSDIELKPSNLKSKLRKSVDKLTQSGCIRIVPNIFAEKGRESIYAITQKGINIATHIRDNKLEVYRL